LRVRDPRRGRLVLGPSLRPALASAALRRKATPLTHCRARGRARHRQGAARDPTQLPHPMTPELVPYAVPSALRFLGLIITAIAGPVVLSRLNRQDQELKVVRDHVANTHPTNLRDDLDGVGAKIDRVIDSLNMERAERRADTRGMRQEIQFIR